MEAIIKFLGTTGFAKMFAADPGTEWWQTLLQYLIMYAIIGGLFYLAIAKKFEPLLLMPIAFGMLLANLPGAELMHLDFFFDDYYIENGLVTAEQLINEHVPMTRMIEEVINNGGLIDILYLGVKLGIYPSLIFMGV